MKNTEQQTKGRRFTGRTALTPYLHKKSNGAIWLFILLFVTSSCFKEKDTLLGTPTKNLSIYNLKLMDKGSEISLSEDNIGVSPLSGTVISDASAGNIEKGKFVMIQTKEGKTAGITISLQGNPDINLIPGDSVVVNILGGNLKRLDGRLEITNIPLTNVTKVASEKTVKPIMVSLNELAENFNNYESMLISVAGIDIMLETGQPHTYEGTKKMYDASNDPGTINLNTLGSAQFSTEEIPANANFTGIAVQTNGTLNLRIRTLNDVSITSSPLDPTTDLIITGFMSDPKGTDNPAIGNTTSYGNGVTLIQPGSYEYVQLMALRDIDFSVTPYAVVLANNGTVGVNGWAQGGSNTFKFNITEGTVKAGEFCYVGGPAKKLGGYWNCGFSADISHANWVRNIDLPSVGGDDGMGNASYAMNNIAGDGSNIADGIAVFKGTTVTSVSTPIDAVFYGTRILTAYDAANNRGLRVPLNDRYNPVNPETGEAQPFFGQGTNTYLFAQPGSDKSDFSKLGGVVTHNAWIVPRESTITSFYSTNCEAAAAFSLTDIQKGIGITFFRK